MKLGVCVGIVTSWFWLSALVSALQHREWDSEPELIQKVDPVYPEEAEEAGVVGEVVLEIEVDKDGNTSVRQVVRSVEHGCTDAAVEAAKQWRWKPAELNGEPVESQGVITLAFPPGTEQ